MPSFAGTYGKRDYGFVTFVFQKKDVVPYKVIWNVNNLIIINSGKGPCNGSVKVNCDCAFAINKSDGLC